MFPVGPAETPVPLDLLDVCHLAAWMRWPSLDISREGSTANTLPGWPPYTWEDPKLFRPSSVHTADVGAPCMGCGYLILASAIRQTTE